jgi:hypothetical protein
MVWALVTFLNQFTFYICIAFTDIPVSGASVLTGRRVRCVSPYIPSTARGRRVRRLYAAARYYLMGKDAAASGTPTNHSCQGLVFVWKTLKYTSAAS